MIIDSAGRREFDAEALSAVAPSVVSAAQTLAAEVTWGRLVQAMAEFENGIVIMEPLGESGVLLVITESVASIDRVRLVARRRHRAENSY